MMIGIVLLVNASWPEAFDNLKMIKKQLLEGDGDHQIKSTSSSTYFWQYERIYDERRNPKGHFPIENQS